MWITSADDKNTMTTNELQLYDKMSNSLQARRPETVFPLAATHRKELRELRDRNVGELRTQLAFIKSEKKKDYLKKYKVEVANERKDAELRVASLNQDYKDMVVKIHKLVLEQNSKEVDLLSSIKDTETSSGYGVLSSLYCDDVKNSTRVLTVNSDRLIENICNKEFEEKYKMPFEEVGKKIDKLNEMYEEAINFGDLEQVKEIYYLFKDAEKFLTKVRQIEV